MAESLMFPEIDAAALKPTSAPTVTAAAVAIVPPISIDLAKLDLEAVALAQFDTSLTAIAVATKTLTGVVHDLSTAGKLADAKSLRHRLINTPLAEARKVETGLKSKLTAVSKAVGAKLVIIEADFKTAAGLITPQIEAREAEIEAEEKRKADEAAAKAAEAAKREEWLQGELSKIHGYGTACKELPAARVLDGIAYVEGLAFGEEWGDAAPRAAKAQAETLVMMRALHAEKIAAEQAAAAAEALRLENERKAAELAEQQRALKLQQDRMDGVKWLNARVVNTQAAIIGMTCTDALDFIASAIAALDGAPVGDDQYGDLAPMAAMAKTMALQLLRSMLAEKQERIEAERQAKEVADELATAEAAQARKEPALELEDEKPARDWPDLQSTELACAPKAEAPAEIASATFTRVGDVAIVTRTEPPHDELAYIVGNTAALAPESSRVCRPYALTIDIAASETDDPLPILLTHIEKAFDCKFPTQPKPGVEWWAELRRLAGEVRA